jgi:dihydroxyacid dehydratase/phosphogluconate dehydratase
MAMGGSTNAIIHVIAMARRAGSRWSLEAFDKLGPRGPGARECPPIRNFLMEDFFYAGGCRR